MLTRVERDGSFVAIDKAEEAGELIVSVPIGHRFPPDAPAQMRRAARLDARGSAEAGAGALAAPRLHEDHHRAKKAAWVEIEATRRRGYAISRAEFSPAS